MQTKKIITFLFVLLSFIQMKGQSSDNVNTVSLTVIGEAQTKDEATKIALRSAIDQAFGTFVSSNTTVLNDEIVKDEIVSLNKGMIQSYKEISDINLPNGLRSVTLQAVVSIEDMVQFAQSKGMSTELAGATFAMNKKMRDLNKKNEQKVILHLIEQVKLIVKRNCFDYSVVVGEPKNNFRYKGYNDIPVKITATLNENGHSLGSIFEKTLSSLSLKETEVEEYKKRGEFYKEYNIKSSQGNKSIYLRNNWATIGGFLEGIGSYISLGHFYNCSIDDFELKDNMGNVFRLHYRVVKDGEKPLIRSKYGVGSNYKIYGFFQNSTVVNGKNIFYSKDVSEYDHPHKFIYIDDYEYGGCTYILDQGPFVLNVTATYSDDDLMKLSSITVNPLK